MPDTPVAAAADTGPRVTREQIRDLSTLRRAKAPRLVGGVAEGLSRHLDIDPLIIRVVFAALSVFGGAGIALYVLTWVTIPEEGEDDSILSRPLRRDPYRVMLAGLGIAALATVATMFGAISLSTPNPVPVLVISIVALTAFALFSRRSDSATPAYPRPTDLNGGARVPAEGPTGDDLTAVIPVGGFGAGGPDGGGAAPTPSGPPPAPPPPRAPRPPQSHLFGMTMACLAIALGILWVVDVSIHHVAPAVFPGTALAVIASGLVVGAWWGRSRLLIVAGLVATVATVAATVVGPGPYGSRSYHPASVSALPAAYHMGAGQIVVHLEDLSDPSALDGRTLAITSHIGQVELIVPTSADVAVNAHVDHGDTRGLRDVQSYDNGEKTVTAPPGAHDLTVNIALDFGEIVVKRLDCPGVAGGTLDRTITLTTTEDPDVAPACH